MAFNISLLSPTSTSHQEEEEDNNSSNIDEIQVYEECSRTEMVSDIVQEPESSLLLTEGVSIPEVEINQQNVNEVQSNQEISSIDNNKIDYDEYCDEDERQEKVQKQKARRKRASVVYQNRQAYIQRPSSLVDSSQPNEIALPKAKRKKRNNIEFISSIPLLDSKRHCHGRDGHHDHSIRMSERNKKTTHINKINVSQIDD